MDYPIYAIFFFGLGTGLFVLFMLHSFEIIKRILSYNQKIEWD